MNSVEPMIDLAELQGTLGNWKEAKSTAETARVIVEANRVLGNYDHDEKYVYVLEAIKGVYEITGDLERMVEVGLEVGSP